MWLTEVRQLDNGDTWTPSNAAQHAVDCLPLVLQRRKKLRKCQVMDFSGVHADPGHPVDVLFGLNPANGQSKVMSEHCSAA